MCSYEGHPCITGVRFSEAVARMRAVTARRSTGEAFDKLFILKSFHGVPSRNPYPYSLRLQIGKVRFLFGSTTVDSSALNRGHEHQRAMRRWNARDGRPRCFGGAQRGSGT